MLSRLHSAVVSVEDLSSAVNHYAALLGRSPTHRAFADERTEIALFRLANMTLELRADGESEGLSSIRLGADSLEEAKKHLAERGVQHAATREVRLVEGDASGVVAAHPPFATFRGVRVDPASSRGIAVDLVEPIEWPPGSEEAAAGLDDPAGIRALDHVVIFSGSIDRTRAFYEDDLGIRLALDRTFEKRGVRLIFFRLGGTTIEIGGRLDAPVEEESPDRFGGLAWQVNDIDAIQTRLLGAGFDVSEVRDGHKAGTRVCTARDRTHGVPTLLIEPVR